MSESEERKHTWVIDRIAADVKAMAADVRETRESVIRLEEKLEPLKADVADLEGRFDGHSKRLKTIETEKATEKGAAKPILFVICAVIISLVSAGVARLF